MLLLSSLALFIRKCPICFGEKDEASLFCFECRQKKTVLRAERALEEAKREMAVANAKTEKRRSLFEEPVLSLLKIPEKSVWHPANNDIPPYLEVKWSLPDLSEQDNIYHLPIFIFGTTPDDRGADIPVMIEFKEKIVKKQDRSEQGRAKYVRAEKIQLEGIKPDVRFHCTAHKDMGGLFTGGLPVMGISSFFAYNDPKKEVLAKFLMGFTKA